MRIKTMIPGVLCISMILCLVSCDKKMLRRGRAARSADLISDTATIPAIDVQESTVTTEGDIRGEEFAPQENIRNIQFDFDAYTLSDEVRRILQQNADIIRTHPEWTVLVEGHCDERGTIEYNLALGQKRAKEVRDYYIRLGIPENFLGTISYGKEKPACTESTEDCWSQNRRAETKVRNK